MSQSQLLMCLEFSDKKHTVLRKPSQKIAKNIDGLAKTGVLYSRRGEWNMQNDRLSNKQSQLLFSLGFANANTEILVDKLLFISHFVYLVNRKEKELIQMGETKTLTTKNLISELKAAKDIREYTDIASLIVRKAIDSALVDNRLSEGALYILSSLDANPTYEKQAENAIISFVNSVDEEQIADYLSQRLNSFFSNGREQGQFFTPNSIVNLAVALFNFKDCSRVADFCSGTGNFLSQAADYNKKAGKGSIAYFGFETDYESVAISKINLLLRTMDANIQQADVLTNDLGKFDYVFSEFPLGGIYNKTTEEIGSHMWYPIHIDRVSRSSFSWVYMAKAINSLVDGGTAICIAPQGALFSTYEASIRKQVIEGGYLSAIITLPKLHMPYSGVATSMLIFHKHHDDKIVIVDASKFVVADKRKAILAEDAISAIKHLIEDKINSDCSKVISYNDIREADYNLLPERYLIKELPNPIKLPNPKPLDVVKEVIIKSAISDSKKLTASSASGIRVIKSSDIENGLYDIDRLDYLEEIPENVERYFLQEGDVLLTNKSTKIKTAVVKNLGNEKLIMFGSLYGIRVNKSIINPDYLQCYLNSNVGNLELARLQTGTTIQCITQVNLLTLQVPCPSLEEQNKVISEYRLKLEMLEDSKRRAEKLEKDISEMFSHFIEE